MNNSGRARLTKILLFSLGDAPEEGVEQAWTEEANRRLDEIRRGDVETQDSDDVFREARFRSELPVARTATGRTLPDLTNTEIHRILDDEETAASDLFKPSTVS
jgi:hypothetical protein